MPKPCLRIHLAPILPATRVGPASWNQVHGGPEELLRWLETQLGLLGPPIPRADRVNQLAGLLDKRGSELVFQGSYQADRWGTTSDLLARVDEVRLAGWDRITQRDLPAFLQDVARCSEGCENHFHDTAARLERVLAGLADGQVLPDHELVLGEPMESWPAKWQTVLGKMNLASEPDPIRPAPAGDNALHRARGAVLGQRSGEITPDASLRFVVAHSTTLACGYLGNLLAQHPEQLPETAILCEDDHVAFQLDSVLRGQNLPTMGIRLGLSTHPVLQLMPLTISLLWQPVDPQALLDYLTLPVCPIRRRFARRLARSLLVMPGIGSLDWEKTLREIHEDPEIPEEEKVAFRERYATFLGHERAKQGGLLETKWISNQFRRLAQWAAGYAGNLGSGEASGSGAPDDAGLRQALMALAGQASALAGMVQNQGKSISGPQLRRLLEELQAQGVGEALHPESALGPVRIRSLAEIGHAFRHLVWLGVGTSAGALDPWSRSERDRLQGACNLKLPDPLDERRGLRALEAQGFGRITGGLLAIQLPSDETRAWHPLWIQVRNLLPGEFARNPPVLDEIIAKDEAELHLAPHTPVLASRSPVQPQPARPLWEFPGGSLQEPDSVSATELEDRLACPLKWVFSRQLGLKPGSVARLPADARLEGNFCHSVLKLWFDLNPGEDDPKSVGEGVGGIFDARLALDAAPLAQPDRALKAMQVRGQLVRAAKTLVTTLKRGGYRIVGLESKIEGKALGKTLRGSIDCLAEKAGPPRGEAVIDFKMHGLERYTELLESGKAIQLATYAHARGGASGGVPKVAYLVLGSGQLRTPQGSAVEHAEEDQVVTGGPNIEMVWRQFEAAVIEAGAWLEGKEPVPARPLQEPAGDPAVRPWPRGVELVLDASAKDPGGQKACTYCDHRKLCGLEALK